MYPRKQRKLSPTKFKCYTVVLPCYGNILYIQCEDLQEFSRAHIPCCCLCMLQCIWSVLRVAAVCMCLDDLYLHNMLGNCAHEQKAHGGAVDRCGPNKRQHLQYSTYGPYQTIRRIMKLNQIFWRFDGFVVLTSRSDAYMCRSQDLAIFVLITDKRLCKPETKYLS